MILLLSLFYIIVGIVESHQHTKSIPGSDCFSVLLNATQSCDNKNILYVTTMGQTSGLGSEFNAYLVYSLLEAMTENRRMVYLKSKREWEYDCSSKSGWACYLNFACNPKGVEPSEMDFTNQGNVHDPLSLGSSFLEKQLRLDGGKFGEILNRLKNMFLKLKKNHDISIDSCEDIFKMSQTVITSAVAKYLYKLNPETRLAIRKINSRYRELHRSGYHSLQLRLSDKYYEMDFVTWVWMTNITNTAEMLKPYFTSSNYKYLYTASDNCTAIGILADLMKPIGVTLFGNCFNETTNALIVHTGSESTVRLKTYDSTIRLLADIEMLKKGEHFFGLFDSNLVRLIHKLRYPNFNQSHALAASTYNNHKKNVDSKMDNLPWGD